MAKQRVLILCTANSARSQMAEGLLRYDAEDRFDVESAGTRATHVRPEAIAVMKEIGIDISSHRSKIVDEFADQSFDHVLTVCDNARERCPIFPGHGNQLHYSFDDPAAVNGSEQDRLAAFRRVRDEIRAYLRTFSISLGIMKSSRVTCVVYPPLSFSAVLALPSIITRVAGQLLLSCNVVPPERLSPNCGCRWNWIALHSPPRRR